MTDIRLALWTGIDIPVEELSLIVHQPTITEISYIGDTDFFTGVQSITINKTMITQGETLLANINNFQIFMKLMTEKETVDKKNAVLRLFQLILPNYQVMFTPRSMILREKTANINITIDDNNFEILQEVVKQIFCVNSGPGDQQSFNPANAKAKEIADKLMRARQRVAEIKGEGTGSIFVQYASVVSVALHISPRECNALTMFQLFDLVERYSLWLNWDLDIKSRLAGGQPDSKPDNWMKNLY